MKAAYADPPYLGKSAFGATHHYGDRHPDAADYNRIETHAALIDRLSAEFDAWAYSLHSPSLRDILPLCSSDVRVGAWVKPFCSYKPGVNPAYAWEPVIFRGARKRERKAPKIRDYLSANININTFLDGKPFPGSKPPEFCWWIFDFLGLEPDDEFADLFPGSGAVGRAWEEYRRAKRDLPLFAAGS
jgi:hypothetical protein